RGVTRGEFDRISLGGDSRSVERRPAFVPPRPTDSRRPDLITPALQFRRSIRMLSKKTLFVWLLTIAVAQVAFAQATTTATTTTTDTTAAAPATPAVDGGTPTYLRPETPEQRAARVGPVDPGTNPDPKETFYRYGKRYHIEKYDNVRSR